MIVHNKIVEVDVNKIITDGKNPNVMSKKKLEALEKNLKKYGNLVPIILNKNLVIADGEQRFSVYKKLKMKKIPAIVLDVSEVDRRILRQVLNKLHGEHDSKLDDEEFKFIFDEGSFDEFKELCCIDDKELVSFLAGKGEVFEDDFDTEEALTKPKYEVKLGDVWQLGSHRLMCGDSTKSDDIKSLMNGEKANMVFTDPPYGVNYAGKNNFLNQWDKGTHVQDEIVRDNGTIEETSKLWLESFKRIKENLAEESSYYITGPQGGDLHLMMLMMKEAGLILRHQLIWVKNNHVLGRTDYNYKHEPILYGWIKKHKFYNGGEQKFSVWNYNKPNSSKLHPTMKPIELISNAIKNSSKEKTIILDIFGGSGSTLIAAEQLNRKCYMMEIDPKYCSVIIQRFIKFKGSQNNICVIRNGQTIKLENLEKDNPVGIKE